MKEPEEDDPFCVTQAQRKREAAHRIAMMSGSTGPETMRRLIPKLSSAEIRHASGRPKIKEDLAKLEAARKKRERKERQKTRSKEH